MAKKTVMIEVPVGEVPPSEFPIHVDFKLLGAESTALRRMAAGLERRRARLANGTYVQGPQQALKYLCQQASQAMET